MSRPVSKKLEAAKIVLLCILASIVYGIVHDQVTARIYLPYFNVWPPHAEFFQHPDPTVVGLFWGIFATWWVGLILGVLLAWVSTSGEGHCWGWRLLVKPLAILLLSLLTLAFIGLGLCLALGLTVNPSIPGPAIDPGNQTELVRFTANLVSHNVSYFGGAIGGVFLAWYVARKRKRINFHR